jgi:hypothetical protein
MRIGVALPFRFDVDRLREDLAKARPEDWAPHYNRGDFGGVWRGAALRSASGDATDLHAGAGPQPFTETDLLRRCAYFREVLAAFACPLRGARLLGLGPGSFIREHTDDALDFEDGEVRIHIPIQTNAGVEFWVRRERVAMEPGGTYYINVNLPHRVSNRGATERVHLVIDAEVNDWLREVFARSGEIPRGVAAVSGADAFRERALTDADLGRRLRGITDRREFAREAARLGRVAGFEFDEGDVDALLDGDPRPGPPGGLAYRLQAREGEPFLTWTDPAERGLSEPFYEDTVRAMLRTPWGKFSRRVAPLRDGAARPKGFVFHMSRCGSTLVAQMLKAAGYRVASEPAVADAALQSNPRWLREVAAALDVDFIKFDAWHTHKLGEVRAAFPETPWVFVHRDIEEVLASQRRSPGQHALPGAMDPAALQMTMAEVTGLARDEWTEVVLKKIMASAERHRDAAALWVDYRELPDAVWGPVARHFGIELTATQIERMRETARFDAKAPGQVFGAFG